MEAWKQHLMRHLGAVRPNVAVSDGVAMIQKIDAMIAALPDVPETNILPIKRRSPSRVPQTHS
jgi:hypothetical protein